MDETQRLDDSFMDDRFELDADQAIKPLAKLRVFKNEHIPETELPLYLGENMMGRDPISCSLPLDARSVSKQHAVISLSVFPGDRIHVSPVVEALVWDLGSMNGTRKGRFRLTPHVRYALTDGDSVVLADLPCQYIDTSEVLREGSAEPERVMGGGELPAKGRGRSLTTRMGKEHESTEGGWSNSIKNTKLKGNVKGGRMGSETVTPSVVRSMSLSLAQTPACPENLHVLELDSDSDDSTRARKGPTCSTFLSPMNSIVPESEDENSVTPSSSVKDNSHQRMNQGGKGPATTKRKPQMLVYDSDSELEEQETLTKKHSITCLGDMANEQQGLPEGMAIDATPNGRTGPSEDVGMDKSEAGPSSDVPQPCKPGSQVSSGGGSRTADSEEELKDLPQRSDHHSLGNNDPKKSSIQDGPSASKPSFSMDSDTDVEGEEGSEQVVGLGSGTEATDKTCKSPRTSMVQPEEFHLDSDTDIEDNEDNAPMSPSTLSPNVKPSSTTTIVQTEFHRDSDRESKGSEDSPGELVPPNPKPSTGLTEPLLVKCPGLHLSSDTDDEATDDDPFATSVRETQGKRGTQQPAGGRVVDLKIDSSSDSDVESSATQLFASTSKPELGSLLHQPALHSSPTRGAAQVSSSDSDTDVEEPGSVKPGLGPRLPAVHLCLDSDTDVEDGGEDGAADTVDGADVLLDVAGGAMASGVVDQKCSTPVTLLPEMDTQLFISMADPFRRPPIPPVFPSRPSEGDQDDLKDDDFFIAETQSFVSEAPGGSSTGGPAAKLPSVLSSPPSSESSAPPGFEEQPTMAYSFQLGLPDSSHECPGSSSRPAQLGLIAEDELNATQAYAADTVTLSSGTVEMDRDLDATQAYVMEAAGEAAGAVQICADDIMNIQVGRGEDHQRDFQANSHLSTADTQPVSVLEAVGVAELVPEEEEDGVKSSQLQSQRGSRRGNEEDKQPGRSTRSQRRAAVDQEPQKRETRGISKAGGMPTGNGLRRKAVPDEDVDSDMEAEGSRRTRGRKSQKKGKDRVMRSRGTEENEGDEVRGEERENSERKDGKRFKKKRKEQEEREERERLENERREQEERKERERLDKERKELEEREERARLEKESKEQEEREEREKLEKERKEREERKVLEKEKEREEREERERLEKERKEQEEREERARLEKERKQREEREKLEKESKEREEREVLEKEKKEREEREERERLEKERKEQEEREERARLEKERKQREEREKLEKERKEQEEREERERLEKERLEKKEKEEREEREKLEKEGKEREEREKLEKEREERKRLEKERKETEEREKLEKERKEQEEREERERLEKEKLEKERKEQEEREEREKLEKERKERERLEKKRKEQKRLEKEQEEREERERLEKEQEEREEREKLEKERKERERLEKKRKEQKRLEKEQEEREERERLEKEKEREEERKEQERLQKEQEEREEKERLEKEQDRRKNVRKGKEKHGEQMKEDEEDLMKEKKIKRKSARGKRKQEQVCKEREKDEEEDEEEEQRSSSQGRWKRTRGGLAVADEPRSCDNDTAMPEPELRRGTRASSRCSLVASVSSEKSTSSIGTQGRGHIRKGQKGNSQSEYTTLSVQGEGNLASNGEMGSCATSSSMGTSAERAMQTEIVQNTRSSTTKGADTEDKETHHSSAKASQVLEKDVPGPSMNDGGVCKSGKVSPSDTATTEADQTIKDSEADGEKVLHSRSKGRTRSQKHDLKGVLDDGEQTNTLKVPVDRRKSHRTGKRRGEELDGDEMGERGVKGEISQPAVRKGMSGAASAKKIKQEEREEDQGDQKEEQDSAGSVQLKSRGRQTVAQRKKESQLEMSEEQETKDETLDPTSEQDRPGMDTEVPQTPVGRGSRKRVASSKSPAIKTPRRSSIQATSPAVLTGSPQAPKVLFTCVTDEAGEAALSRLGGSLARDVADMTHLVTDRVRRTVKFLCAVARGVPVVTPCWLEKCSKNGAFLSPQAFLVKDVEQERKFNFCLEEALQTARTQPLLQGYEIHVTRSVKPDPAQMKDIITCSGARYLSRMPTVLKPQTVVISCAEDASLCGPALAASIPVLSAEFLLTGILQQKVDLVTHSLVGAGFGAPENVTPKGRRKR
ncbi:mediator of DNA damage checkpoint protein 1 [Brienomyrus brachyistius]|uniref:mediator of DNA damage checkpoint protein 1 n=1 Tax=Brienomyrus brachyistius TaxID=42636 RepID=UPI0020B32E59|nr:mediator of DNA damage checkpoint protein 1 [Brienomyrus brachyistius]XP_048881975.1 mediator of DNA damage checkpoint protein 1 [Brienomyrus brachyistius]